MNDLFELMMELTDINTYSAVYVSFLLGITLKFILAWNVNYSFIDSISATTKTTIIQPSLLYTKIINDTGNLILIRIIKYIRRKKRTQDDPEDSISSFQSQINLFTIRRKYDKLSFETYGVSPLYY